MLSMAVSGAMGYELVPREHLGRWVGVLGLFRGLDKRAGTFAGRADMEGCWAGIPFPDGPRSGPLRQASASCGHAGDVARSLQRGTARAT